MLCYRRMVLHSDKIDRITWTDGQILSLIAKIIRIIEEDGQIHAHDIVRAQIFSFVLSSLTPQILRRIYSE
jgi:hypothetical protein